ncbi:MAG: transposase [Bacillota bacterium]
MARGARLEYPGALYHVIQRGNNKEHIFERTEDKEYLIEQLRKSVAVDGIELYAYAVMSNHYHLALRTCVEPLRKVMHRINTRYGHYYNRANERSGHVFEGRYKAITVENERYLISLIRYIHKNPVRAGICSKIQDYHWSSDRFYRMPESSFVETGLLLDIISGGGLRSVQKYNLFMDQEDDEPINIKLTLPKNNEQESRYQAPKSYGGKKPLGEILAETGVNQEEIELIKRGCRKRRLTAAKEKYAKKAFNEGYSMGEIARYIRVSAVAVFKYINRLGNSIS